MRAKFTDHTSTELLQAVFYRLSSIAPIMGVERYTARMVGRWFQYRQVNDCSRQSDNVTLIIATAGMGNIGDQAMFEASISAVEGPIVAFIPKEGAFAVPEAARNRVELIALDALVNGGVIAAQRARVVFSRFIARASRLVVIGADIMDGGYQSREAALRLLCLELAHDAGLDCRIVGFSWSAHPNAYIVRRFRDLPQGIRRCARDRLSLDRMVDAGIGGVELAADVVFAHRMVPRPSAFSDWARQECATGRPLAVVNVSGLLLKRLSRQGQGDDYLREMTQAVNQLVIEGYSVVLLPHVLRSGDDDLSACALVASVATTDHVQLVNRLLTPAEILAVVECAAIVMSARMHLGILTLSMGRPCVLFDTQGKVQGLMEEFNLSSCVLSPEQCSAELLLTMVGQAREVAISDAIDLGRQRMRDRAEVNFSTQPAIVDRSVLRLFAENSELQTHSGIYPLAAVTEKPVLMRCGEYSDPAIDDAALEAYARVAASGPLREPEDSLAAALFSAQPGMLHNSDIGWYSGLYTGHISNEDDRRASSSGGLTTALLVSLFQSGEITGVIHMCHSDSGPLFEYRVSRSVEEIREGSRTRYYPGSLYAALEEIRLMDGRYAVVGIPSFLSELRRLENSEPLLKERIVVHIGLVCGHQKTANYATYLAWQAGISPGSLVDIDFRAKIPGKPANEYSTIFRYADSGGNVVEKLVDQSQLEGTNWGLGMFKSLFSDFSDDAFNETADIVFGDAWLPQFTQDYLGTNIVIVRDQHLGEVLSDLATQEIIELTECSDEAILASQSSLLRHSRREINYRLAWFSRKNWSIPDVRRALPPQPATDGFRRGIQRQRARIARTSHDAFVRAVAADSLGIFRRKMIPLTLQYRILDRSRRRYNTFRARIR